MSVAIKVSILIHNHPEDRKTINCDVGFWGQLPPWVYAIYWLITRWLSGESAIYICFFLFKKPFVLKV